MLFAQESKTSVFDFLGFHHFFFLYRITEWWGLEETSGSSGPTPLPKQGTALIL